MTIHEFAAMLDGREIGNEITHEEGLQAKELGYIVVYGASDDLCEFEGAICDEANSYDGREIYIFDGQIVESPGCDCKYAEQHYQSQKKRALRLDALWCPEGNNGPSWAYRLHSEREVATFNVMERGEVYCRGIVFSL